MTMPVPTEIMGVSPVYSLPEEFLRAVDDFAAMQMEHRVALVAGNSRDIFYWQQTRERAFRNLVRKLENVVTCAQENDTCALHAQEILGKLLAEEDLLQELVLDRQLKVQEQLLLMRKGKEALQGYNINKGLIPRPRYLSNRM